MVGVITEVWTAVLQWIVTAFDSTQAIFYNATEESLTFLGILAVIGVAIGICLLVVSIIQGFLKLRG